ncbi:MAG: lysylphosphatidylglycerol synthase transmembrane domain-containing protein [Candidatus Woesearchaeota archaeon]
MKRILSVLVFIYVCVIIGLLWYYRFSFIGVNAWYILGAIAVMAVAHFVFVFSWRYMLKRVGLSISYNRAFSYQCMEDAFMFMPAKTNYLTLPYLLYKKHKISFSRAFGFKLVLIGLELLCAITLLLLGRIELLIYLAVILAGFFFAHPLYRVLSRMWKKLPRASSMKDFLGFSYLVSGYGLLFLFWLLEGVSLYLIIKAFNPEFSMLTGIAIHGLSTIMGAVSLLPGGMGVREGTIAYVLHLNEVGLAFSVPIAILGQVITVLLPVFLGYVYYRVARTNVCVS